MSRVTNVLIVTDCGSDDEPAVQPAEGLAIGDRSASGSAVRLQAMATSIEIDHDPETGAWCFVTSDRSNMLVHDYPDFETWWAWLRREAPEEAALWRVAGRWRASGDFADAVTRIQSGCSCQDCRDAVTACQHAEAARQCVVAAGRRVIDATARAVALYVQESSEPVGVVGEGQIRRPAKLTYSDARSRYMTASGDDEAAEALAAMVGCVTMTVPDLDTIGADWEPAAPTPEPVVAVPGPKMWRAVCGAGLSAAAMLLTALTAAGVLPAASALVAVVVALAAVPFWGRT
jgi:hypothetical protein